MKRILLQSLNPKTLFKALTSTLVAIFILSLINVASAATISTQDFYGIDYEAIIFALMLLGIAVFYKQTLPVALVGTVLLLIYKYAFVDGFSVANKLLGYIDAQSVHHEGSLKDYLNLAFMLPGFALLAHIFKVSNLPSILPKYLPNGALGAAALLAFIFVLSTFLDNIAAAMIGGSMAFAIFKEKVHIGYIAAICAASNAGGVGSVVGDTTTTLMWIDGKDPLVLAQAFLPGIVALIIVAFFASRQQQKYSPLCDTEFDVVKVDSKKLLSVFLILVGAISFNYLLGMPSIGIWLALFISTIFSKVQFKEALESIPGTVFLVALVFSASLVPIDSIPDATALSTFLIGAVSSVFNNIPLTELCLIKGGYDWPLMSFAVGFGGSMIWFGSSAGVAVCELSLKSRSVFNWVRYGWHVTLGFAVGFIVYLVILGWTPNKAGIEQQAVPSVQTEQVVNTSNTTSSDNS